VPLQPDASLDRNTGKLYASSRLLAEIIGNLPANSLPSWCNFALFNNTIDECSNGPWGTVTIVMADKAFAYSVLFELRARDDSILPSLITNNADLTTSRGSSIVTATAKSSSTFGPSTTCPPTGIPSRTPIATTAKNFWPPVEGSLAFPTIDGSWDMFLLDNTVEQSGE
jgi:hypothetical protein